MWERRLLRVERKRVGAGECLELIGGDEGGQGGWRRWIKEYDG